MSERLGAQLQSGGLGQSIHTGLLGGGLFAGASLDLNFAGTKNIGPLVTFTRASTGTYVGSNGVLQTAATDVPRFDHNPTTGESLGLLVEEARTNLIVQSENLGTTWLTTGLLAFGSGSTLNATVAPDGATTADLATENSSTSEHRIETAAISWAASTVYTLTMFAKANGRTRIDFFGVGGGNFTGGRNVGFNLSTGAVIATDGAVASIDARNNGWYRLRMTFTTSAAPSASGLFIRFLDNSNNFSYTGDGTSGMYLWGAQLEAGAFASSYIPTTTAAATRSADVASITGTNFSSWYNQAQGTTYTSAQVGYTVPGSWFPIVAAMNDGTSANRLESGYLTASIAGFGVVVGGVDQGSVYLATTAVVRNLACAYQSNNGAASVNGGAVLTLGSMSVPAVNQLTLGRTPAAGNVLNGTIRRLTYWPQRLANSTLQAITQ